MSDSKNKKIKKIKLFSKLYDHVWKCNFCSFTGMKYELLAHHSRMPSYDYKDHGNTVSYCSKITN